MKSDKNYDDFLKKLAKRIKELRVERGYTQEDMTQFGFNYRHYQELESGTHSPSLSTLFRLAKTFKLNLEEFFHV